MYLKNDHRVVPPTVVAATFVTVDQSQDNCLRELFLLEAVAHPTLVNFDDPDYRNDLIPEQTELHIHAVDTSGPIIAQSCVAYI
jgi:hypothetical protein